MYKGYQIAQRISHMKLYAKSGETVRSNDNYSKTKGPTLATTVEVQFSVKEHSRMTNCKRIPFPLTSAWPLSSKPNFR